MIQLMFTLIVTPLLILCAAAWMLGFSVKLVTMYQQWRDQ